MDHLPVWLNLKTIAAAGIILLGLIVLFRALGEIVKIIIAVLLIAGGAWMIIHFSRPVQQNEEPESSPIHETYSNPNSINR